MVFLGYVTSSPKSRDYRTLIEKGRTKVSVNLFCSFFYALCYKAVLLCRQMVNDDLLRSYTVHRGYSTFSIPRDFLMEITTYKNTEQYTNYELTKEEIPRDGEERILSQHTQCSLSLKKT